MEPKHIFGDVPVIKIIDYMIDNQHHQTETRT